MSDNKRAHALLSASGAHRWLICTPSARLEDSLPESTSAYAEEGRLAHSIAELLLQRNFALSIKTREYNKQLKALQADPAYDPEMLSYVGAYNDYIQSVVHKYTTPAHVMIERRVEYDKYAPEGFGTADCIVLSGNTMHVIDLKYGKGVAVSADDNPQMKLYALGAYEFYKLWYPIDTVEMAIVQPRLDRITETSMPLTELLEWGEHVKPIAQTAFDGNGEFVQGEHCRFCRAKSLCRARMDANLALSTYDKALSPLISNEEVGAIIAQARELKKWAEDLDAYALSACLKGEEIPGWKAVAGRPGRRTYTDVDAAFEVVKEKTGTDDAFLYTQSPLTPAALEKLIGKDVFKDVVSNYITTPPGKPALVPEADKRPVYTPESGVEHDLKSIGEMNYE